MCNLFKCIPYSTIIWREKIQMNLVNGKYSLLVRASYFIFCSKHAGFTSVILLFENGIGGACERLIPIE